MKYFVYLIGLVSIYSCQRQHLPIEDAITYPVSVELSTSKGDIVLKLSDQTPIHRDNFIKNVRKGVYNQLTFHRVIDEFMIQAGEYDSLKTVSMDSVALNSLDGYIPAEFNASLFHKRGALCAARDGNPDRASSSLQFYIVQAGPQPDSIINKGEGRINDWLHQHKFIHEPGNEQWIQAMGEIKSLEEFMSITDTIKTLSAAYNYDRYEIPKPHREAYKTLGGTPHLDQNYTVFGEVISGMSVVDEIAKVQTNEAGRPDETIYIIRAKIVD